MVADKFREGSGDGVLDGCEGVPCVLLVLVVLVVSAKSLSGENLLWVLVGSV